ncbi:MAG: DUF1232 domain-containing protein [Eubacteriales bacterium]|nr:DUF1232 domain-containing protein [Eubacteriales bacterium]MDD3199023.1 DUF1232 domain-containing protein [Eubacteriales bacterium]MDD4121765.1 DUF1232 domain-containing protein [Eubacteriales bacterium]MDD4629491.1 DUF1232 domain-containing protein [Eubacteriales bacterium]
MQFIFFQIIFKRIKAIRHFIKDKEVPLRKKLIIIFGIIYLLSPIDLIPAPVLLFNVVDDITLWTFILWYLKDELDKYWVETGPVKPERLRGKDIIKDVNYKVEKEDIEE